MYQLHPPRRHSSPGGEFVNDCGGGVYANSNTSCPFAQNVANKWQSANSQGAASAAQSWVIDVWSPVTNQNYTMTCEREGDAVICRGGNDAAVSFYIE
jgi:hypothetical protein